MYAYSDQFSTSVILILGCLKTLNGISIFIRLSTATAELIDAAIY